MKNKYNEKEKSHSYLYVISLYYLYKKVTFFKEVTLEVCYFPSKKEKGKRGSLMPPLGVKDISHLLAIDK